MKKIFQTAKAIAKPMPNNNSEHQEMPELSKKQFANSIKNSKFNSCISDLKTNIRNSETIKFLSNAFTKMLDAIPKACLRGLVIGIILNIIAANFWPDLPETIPTIYEFFNGFVTLAEFLYKTALGGIASLFNGTFAEFDDALMAEIGELWNQFVTWISSISF